MTDAETKIYGAVSRGDTAAVEAALAELRKLASPEKGDRQLYTVAGNAAEVALKHRKWETLAYLADCLNQIENSAVLGGSIDEAGLVRGERTRVLAGGRTELARLRQVDAGRAARAPARPRSQR